MHSIVYNVHDVLFLNNDIQCPNIITKAYMYMYYILALFQILLQEASLELEY